MSGDVQPRKRKDKKKKKDELGVEEPRGTAAVFGEGDVYMHSHHEHGTGGHWCAKVIFFSLLAVLIGLIGLIILENRGLTDLEANQVESRYSGVLEGWLEDAPDDDHHDEHTLELNHHDDDDEDDHGNELEHDDEDDGQHDDDEDHNVDDNEEDQQHEDDDDEDDEDDQNDDDDEQAHQDDDDDDEDDEDGTANEVDENDEDDENDDDDENNDNQDENNDEQANDNDDDDDDDDDSAEKDNIEANDAGDNIDSAEDEDEIEPVVTKRYKRDTYFENDDDDDDDDDLPNDDGKNDLNNDSEEKQDDPEDEEEHDDEPEDDPEVEVEHIEKEVSDDEVFSREKRSALEDDSQEVSTEAGPVDVDEDDDVEFLEPDELDDELPEVLPIPVPKGRPLAEVEDTPSSERPHDTLAEEEEYEREQEALRKEKEQSSQGLWLKLTIGGALLVATQAVLRRFTAPREPEESDSREETPVDEGSMTQPEPSPTVAPIPEVKKLIQREVIKQAPVVAKPPPPKEESEEEEDDEVVIIKSAKPLETVKDIIDKELFSDDEEEEEEEEPKVIPKSAPIVKQPIFKPPSPVKEPSPEIEEDVEIIDEEQLEEEMEEEEGDVEDDISDVDDAELLTRLEAKYGRLPEPERPGRKTGGDSIEDMWPGEPSDPYWRDELDNAEQDLRQGDWSLAEKRANVPELRTSARARHVIASALDAMAEAKRDNQLLTKAIAAYLELLKMNERLSDKKLVEVAARTLERIKFRGNYLGAEPIYRLLIRRFPNDVNYRNNLTISFLMANRADLAEEVLKETLQRWPDDRLALAHYGFVLKTQHSKQEEAVGLFTKALEGDTGPACEPRFYYHLGDSLLLLGRFAEAHEVHKRGAANGHFLSPSQRSLYNVDRLQSKPWWDPADTPYSKLVKSLEDSWRDILREGEAAKKLYESETEGLREKGEWSQLDLFVRGREVPDRCSRAPVTCGIVHSERGAAGCRRGQVKFSAMQPGTHVRPHVGPTNCRLRMHLGLANTEDTYIRVDKEIRQWQPGKVIIFDDSFEHEVWHNGSGTRLVLIVDVWHPQLTQRERTQLPPI